MVVKSESVMGEILKKLPCEPPEIGGILGGKNGVVTCHVLDYGKTGGSPCSYTPNIAYLNRKIEEWFKDGIEFMCILVEQRVFRRVTNCTSARFWKQCQKK